MSRATTLVLLAAASLLVGVAQRGLPAAAGTIRPPARLHGGRPASLLWRSFPLRPTTGAAARPVPAGGAEWPSHRSKPKTVPAAARPLIVPPLAPAGSHRGRSAEILLGLIAIALGAAALFALPAWSRRFRARAVVVQAPSNPSYLHEAVPNLPVRAWAAHSRPRLAQRSAQKSAERLKRHSDHAAADLRERDHSASLVDGSAVEWAELRARSTGLDERETAVVRRESFVAEHQGAEALSRGELDRTRAELAQRADQLATAEAELGLDRAALEAEALVVQATVGELAAREAQLADASTGIESQRAELERAGAAALERARAEAVEHATAERGLLEQHAPQLDQAAAELARGHDELAQRKAAHDEAEELLERNLTEFDDRAAALARLEAALGERELRLGEVESTAAGSVAELDERSAALAAAEQVHAEQERELAEAETEADRRWRLAEADYLERVERLAQAEARILERERQLASLSEGAASAGRNLDRDRAELAERIDRLAADEARLAERERAVRELEDACTKADEALVRRQTELDPRDAELEHRQQEVDLHVNQLETAEAMLAEQERTQARAAEALDGRRVELEQRATAIAAVEREFANGREEARLRLVELEQAASEAAARNEGERERLALRAAALAAAEARQEQVAAKDVETAEPERAQPSATGHLLFIATPVGYVVVEREGAPPAERAEITLAVGAEPDERFVVSRLGRSPIPFDDRPCAHLERPAV